MSGVPAAYPSLDAWLATTGRHVTARHQLAGGLSGATIERLTLTAPDQPTEDVIMKTLDPASDWVMRASNDQVGREIMLARSRLWPAITTVVASPIQAVVASGERAKPALVMTDVGATILPASLSYEPVDEALLTAIIEACAAFHAACWAAPELDASWLASPADALFFLTPQRLTGARGEEDTYGMQALRMWPYLWRFLDDETATPILATMASPGRLLAAVTAVPRTLAHGDLWLANVGFAPTAEGAPPARMITLDWALATAGPATYDSLWLAHTWHAVDPWHALNLHRAALARRGVTAVADDATWSLLVDLAWVRTFYIGAEWMVREVRGATNDNEDGAARDRLRFWAGPTARILRDRGW